MALSPRLMGLESGDVSANIVVLQMFIVRNLVMTIHVPILQTIIGPLEMSMVARLERDIATSIKQAVDVGVESLLVEALVVDIHLIMGDLITTQ